MKLKIFVVAVVSVVMTACVSNVTTHPYNKKPLREVSSLYDIKGVYENVADGYQGKSNVSISRLVWKGHNVSHRRIKRVSIKVLDSQRVKVQAVGQEKRFTKILKLYSDKSIKDGAINVSSYNKAQGPMNVPMNVLLLTFGSKSGYKKVMLDSERNLIMEIGNNNNGLLLGLPVLNSKKTYLRFNRVH